MAELVSADDLARSVKCFIDAGHNDFYLRSATEEGVQKMLQCDLSFARGFMSKVFSKLRNHLLPPEAEPASNADYKEAIEHFGGLGQKREHGQQSDYINSLFFTKNVSMHAGTLSRKLRGQGEREGKPLVDKGGRSQLLSDDICRNIITPALENYRCKGQTKWTQVVKLMMRQLLRVQEGIEAPVGILQLLRTSEQRVRLDSAIVQDEDDNDADEVDSDASEDTTGAAAEEEENDDEDEDLDGEGRTTFRRTRKRSIASHQCFKGLCQKGTVQRVSIQQDLQTLQTKIWMARTQA